MRQLPSIQALQQRIQTNSWTNFTEFTQKQWELFPLKESNWKWEMWNLAMKTTKEKMKKASEWILKISRSNKYLNDFSDIGYFEY